MSDINLLGSAVIESKVSENTKVYGGANLETGVKQVNRFEEEPIVDDLYDVGYHKVTTYELSLEGEVLLGIEYKKSNAEFKISNNGYVSLGLGNTF